MNSQEYIIAEFRNYARKLTDEHSAAIKSKYAVHNIDREDRLQVFNNHLSKLKAELQHKIKETVKANAVESSEAGGLLNNLQSIYNSYINDFYKKEF